MLRDVRPHAGRWAQTAFADTMPEAPANMWQLHVMQSEGQHRTMWQKPLLLRLPSERQLACCQQRDAGSCTVHSSVPVGKLPCAAGLAPEIAFFRTAPGALDFPKAHPPDAGGADLYVKTQVWQWCSAACPSIPSADRQPERRTTATTVHLFTCSVWHVVAAAKRRLLPAATQDALHSRQRSECSLQDAHNLLRPETLESLFVLWRVTRRRRYREQVRSRCSLVLWSYLSCA